MRPTREEYHKWNSMKIRDIVKVMGEKTGVVQMREVLAREIYREYFYKKEESDPNSVESPETVSE